MTMERALPEIPQKIVDEAKKLYFVHQAAQEPVTLTPGMVLVLKTIEEDYKEAMDKIKDLSPEAFFFILKLVEAEHNCAVKAAKKLGISPNTVRTQLDRAKLKLGTKSTLQLLLMYSITSKELFERSNK